jgi:predicted DNA-binding mobile mystery protein A
MNYWERRLLCQQIDNVNQSSAWYEPEKGWIRTIRDALGMSAKQLGRRVGLGQPRISRLEEAEIKGDLKLSTLKKIAEGLDMSFVYAFVPKRGMETMVNEQARKIALERMNTGNPMKGLEDEEFLDEEKAKELDYLIRKILMEESKQLWD